MRGKTSTAIFVLALLTLSACSDFSPGDRVTSCDDSPLPNFVNRGENGLKAIELKVMTYNIQGLPKPVKWKRKKKILEIRKQLNDLFSKVDGLDILVVQEMFSEDAISILRDVAAPNFIYGPTILDVKSGAIKTIRLSGLPAPISKFQPSGLAIFSRYPIQSRRKRPFRFFSCAGVDCLANKGGLVAYVSIPEVPAPIVIATTHMNAQDVSLVPRDMHLRAHHQQTDELAELLNEFSGDNPLIVAGDFNMRDDYDRFKWFQRRIPYPSAHLFCKQQPRLCKADVVAKDAEPWMKTQDLQFYRGSESISLQPKQIEIMFPIEDEQAKLSDHPAQIVNWRISWPKLMKPLPGACHYEAPEFENSLPKAGV